MLRTLRILGPTLLLAASACWVPLERGQVMDSRLDKLEAASEAQSRRVDELQRSIEQQEQAVKERVAAVDKKIAELNQAARRSGADLGVSVTRIQDDLAKAKGDLEVEQHKLDELEQRLATGRLRQEDAVRFLRLGELARAGELAKTANQELEATGEGQAKAEGQFGVKLNPKVSVEALNNLESLGKLADAARTRPCSAAGPPTPSARRRPARPPRPAVPLRPGRADTVPAPRPSVARLRARLPPGGEPAR